MTTAFTKIGMDKLRNMTPITEGGEGYIYEYGGDILKIYKKNVDIASKERKITLLIQKNLPKEVIKPIQPVYDNHNNFIGYIMPKVTGEEIRVLTNKKYLKANGIGTNDILKMLVRIQEVIEQIHKAGVCIGDLNNQNILFNSNGEVFFIDCDSWSIGTEKCEVVMDLYRDPLMKGNDFTESTDLYAESILIWKTITRIHPHGGTMNPDLDIMERMRRGISVIDNPAVKIPRTIKSWRNLSPQFIDSLKKVFENKSRTLGGELADMYANLKFCDKDQEYYYGKFDCCPLCDGNAAVISKPKSQGVMGGLTLCAILNESDIKIVLNDMCYIGTDGMVVSIASRKCIPYQQGRFYYFLTDDKSFPKVIIADDREFLISATPNASHRIQKRYKSHICVSGNDIYYISPANTFTKLSVTDSGNGIRSIAKCSYDSYFAADGGEYCIVNNYDGNLIVNCNGTNVELSHTGNIINYGIHRDSVSGKWLVVLQNGSGLFRTVVICGGNVEYDTDQIKYECGLGNLCLSNSTIYIPIDGKIRGYSYQKQAFKDFECDVVTPDSRLIKNGAAFTIVNDENIYKLGK